LDQKKVTGRSEKNRRKNQKSCPEESEKLSGRIGKVARKIQKKFKSGAPKTWHGPTKNHTKRVPESEKKITGRSEKSRRKIQKNMPEDSKKSAGRFINFPKLVQKIVKSWTKISSGSGSNFVCGGAGWQFIRPIFPGCKTRAPRAMHGSIPLTKVQIHLFPLILNAKTFSRPSKTFSRPSRQPQKKKNARLRRAQNLSFCIYWISNQFRSCGAFSDFLGVLRG
jgi:hypothetical protein